MLTKNDLIPLGGPTYQNRFWPLDDRQIETLERIIGRRLPESYRDFISTHGSSFAEEPWVIDGGPNIGLIGLDVFLGEAPSEYRSLISGAADYLEPLGLLVIAHADTGYLYLAPDGSIVFERSGNPELHTVAESFQELLQRAFIDPDL